MWLEEFLIKYWLELALGIIVAVVSKNYKLIRGKISDYRNIKKRESNEDFKQTIIEAMRPMLDDIANRSDSNDETICNEFAALSKQMETINDKLNNVNTGILNVQGNIFKGECKEILRQTEEITEAQYEKCMNDHNVYKNLGGNHDGDQLYDLVTTKYEHQIKQGAV